MQAMADSDYPELDNELQRVLAGPADRKMSGVFQIIKEKQLAATYADKLTELSSRVDPNGTVPAPFIWSTIAELLLNLKSNANLQNSFLKIQSHGLSDATILAMEVSVHDLSGHFLRAGAFTGRFKARPCFYPNSLGRSPCLCQEYFLRKLPNFGPSASHSAYYTVRAFQPLGTQVLSVDRLLADLHRPSGAGACGAASLTTDMPTRWA